MIIIKFWRVVIKEAYSTGSQLIDLAKYECDQIQKSFHKSKRKAELKEKMNQANSYKEWKEYARDYDKLQGLLSCFFIYSPTYNFVVFYLQYTIPYFSKV